jgi:uncharacterized protein
MAWLVRDGTVLASAEVAPSAAARSRGLLGRDSVEGALVLRPCRGVHTLRMRFAIDVAFVDSTGRVIKTLLMRPNRIGIPVWAARTVIEAQAGAFARWGLRVGDTVEVRESSEVRHSNGTDK